MDPTPACFRACVLACSPAIVLDLLLPQSVSEYKHGGRKEEGLHTHVEEEEEEEMEKEEEEKEKEKEEDEKEKED